MTPRRRPQRPRAPCLGGDGGLVTVDRRGNIAMPFNSDGMYRASIDRNGRRRVAIY